MRTLLFKIENRQKLVEKHNVTGMAIWSCMVKYKNKQGYKALKTQLDYFEIVFLIILSAQTLETTHGVSKLLQNKKSKRDPYETLAPGPM